MSANAELRQKLVKYELLLDQVKTAKSDYVEIEGYMVDKGDEIVYLERQIQHLRKRLKFSLVK